MSGFPRVEISSISRDSHEPARQPAGQPAGPSTDAPTTTTAHVGAPRSLYLSTLFNHFFDLSLEAAIAQPTSRYCLLLASTTVQRAGHQATRQATGPDRPGGGMVVCSSFFIFI